MTNSRCVDPEIMERRYPVVLRQFGIRKGSGGRGRFTGGDGLNREIEFLIDLQVSILSERRVFQPFGMEGGEDAKSGSNIWIKKIGNKERIINMGGKSTAKFHAGDRIIISTPGGGGWGKIEDKERNESRSNHVDTRKGSLVDREQAALGS